MKAKKLKQINQKYRFLEIAGPIQEQQASEEESNLNFKEESNSSDSL